jgi:4'-phosphopantetheinyl transferase
MKRLLPRFSPLAGRTRAEGEGADSPEPGYLSLGANEVDVWRAPIGEQPAQVAQLLESLLSPDEIDRASRFHFERDRRLFIVGRGTLRVLLGGYLGRAPQEIAFRYGANGKPLLAPEGAGSPPLHFNVTHSDGIALLAFTRIGDVGIDLERIRDLPDWQAIAEASLSPRQLERLWQHPVDRRREEFFRAWTQQEALLKAAGTGLGGAPPRVEDFQVYSLRAEPGFAAALAVTGTTGRISIRSSDYSAL